MEIRFTTIAITIIAAVFLVKGFRETHNYIKYAIPHQLVQLVLQAHAEQPFQTEWDIQVSREMQDALCKPLTPEQLAMMRAAEAGTFTRRVNCHLVSGKLRGSKLSGVVQVSVVVHSKYSKSNQVYPDTKLRIVVSSNGRQYPTHQWLVTSVEQIT